MGILAGLLAVLLVGAAHLPVPSGPSGPSAGRAGGDGGGELSGFVVGSVPERAGDDRADFATEWGGVAFTSRVWEGAAPGGGYRVGLKVNVLRGAALTDLAALRAFLAEYHEIDPGTWELDPFDHGTSPGRHGDGRAFWLEEPGLAVSLWLDPRRFGEPELLTTAQAVQRKA
ncbi:hypothetical protein ACFO4E_00385 [Nocardiopsis mangrovi]|uniref:Uncharacterized protein n=1 Tax=Nocardiopsis mangrovi TaxID=1179818 RepID=A0ABV9DPJ7_9ACTN